MARAHVARRPRAPGGPHGGALFLFNRHAARPVDHADAADRYRPFFRCPMPMCRLHIFILYTSPPTGHSSRVVLFLASPRRGPGSVSD